MYLLNCLPISCGTNLFCLSLAQFVFSGASGFSNHRFVDQDYHHKYSDIPAAFWNSLLSAIYNSVFTLVVPNVPARRHWRRVFSERTVQQLGARDISRQYPHPAPHRLQPRRRAGRRHQVPQARGVRSLPLRVRRDRASSGRYCHLINV